MNRREFNRLFDDLVVRVKEENIKDSSCLMGYMLGLGNRKLSGYQFAALVDLLLIPAREQEQVTNSPVPAAPVSNQPDALKAAIGAAMKRP